MFERSFGDDEYGCCDCANERGGRLPYDRDIMRMSR